MAYSINNVQLIGNLGRDVEIKRTGSGSAVAVLNLATSESWKDKTTQQWVSESEWHRVVFYGSPAESIATQNLKKGESLYVSGKIKTRKWTDGSGQEKTVVEIIGDTFVPHRQQNKQQSQQAQQRRPAQQQAQQPAQQQAQQRRPAQQQAQQPAQQQAQQRSPAQQPAQQQAQRQDQEQHYMDNHPVDKMPF